jgi:hypothetical protein
MHYDAMRCAVLAALHYSVLLCSALLCAVLHYAGICCTVLRSTVQHSAQHSAE